jgi:anti-anti-sigma factor
MNVETSHTGSTAVAAVSGRVDSANAKSFEEELSSIIDQGATGLVVDCGELNYISSAGLRVFLIAIRKTSAAGGGLALCRVPAHIQEVLEISGFSRLAKVFDTVEEARDSFG